MNINQLNGTTWSPNDDVTFEVIDTFITNWTKKGDVVWDTCEGILDNDDSVIPTAPFVVPGTSGVSSFTLRPGATVTGSGPFYSRGVMSPTTSASSLTLAYTSSMELLVTGLRLDAGASMMIINDESIPLDRAALGLREVIDPAVAGGEYSVATGDARFVATLAHGGDVRVVVMTNDDPIVFRYVASSGAWEFDAFTLEYAEPGIGIWTLELDGLEFSVDDAPV